MKKNKIKNDLILLKRLEDEVYKISIEKAHKLCLDLNILSEIEFTIYQLYLEELKKVTYEELSSYKRLLDLEYLESLKTLQQELSIDSKIITLPKMTS